MTVMILDEEYSTEYFDISDWADEDSASDIAYDILVKDVLKLDPDEDGKVYMDDVLEMLEKQFRLTYDIEEI